LPFHNSAKRITLAVLIPAGLILFVCYKQEKSFYIAGHYTAFQRIMAAWKLPPKRDGLKVTLRYNPARNGSVSFVQLKRLRATRGSTIRLFRRRGVLGNVVVTSQPK